MTKKQTKLLEAFHGGKIVIIDEFNSSSIDEVLLNNLLMGVDNESKTADKPGFMIFATQNPSTMKGRCKESSAVLTRMQKEVLIKYTDEENAFICTQKLSQIDPMPSESEAELCQPQAEPCQTENLGDVGIIYHDS